MACQACGGDNGSAFLVPESMYGSGESFHYWQCARCLSMWLTDPPADFRPYYVDNYYSLDENQDTRGWLDVYRVAKSRAYYLAQAVNLPWPRGLNKPRHSRFGEPSGLTPGARVLDVGCGSGQLLRELRRAGFRHLTGFDPYMQESTNSGGVHLIRGDWADVEGDFDVIMMHHSLEHMPDPVATLRTACERLSSEGHLVVRIPIVGEAWRVYGVDWVQLDAPRHTVIFSIDGLLEAAGQAGLRLLTSYCDSTSFQFWGSEQNRLGISLVDSRSVSNGVANSPFTQAQIDAWNSRAEELNAIMQGDQATFVFARIAA